MIWSIEESQVLEAQNRVEKAGLLEESNLAHEWLANSPNPVKALEPVQYVAAPYGAGKLITPFATLNQDGFLEGDHAFFSIASAISREKHVSAAYKSGIRESHALAERTALTRGIFTPVGRSSAEIIIAEAIPAPHRKHYVNERLGYLAVLSHEANDSTAINPLEQRTIVQQLDFAALALQKLLPRK